MRTEESEELFLARILTEHYLQAKLPSKVIRGVHDSLNMKHNQAQRTNEWLCKSSVILHVHICQKYIQIQHGYELIYLVCI